MKQTQSERKFKPHTEEYKAKITLQYIVDFIQINNITEYKSVKDIKLIEFQQFIGNKIEYYNPGKDIE